MARRPPGGGSDYREYLERYGFFGEGKPKLPPEEFEQLDDELLGLLARQADGAELNLEEAVRLQELEYLLVLDVLS